MTVRLIGNAVTAALVDRKITAEEVDTVFTAATDGSGVNRSELATLKRVLLRNADAFEPAAKSRFEQRLAEIVVVPAPVVPAQPRRVTYSAAQKPWTTTYWPLADNDGTGNGSASSNLWAKDGPLDKLDALLKTRGKPTGARALELKSNVNWLLADTSVMSGKTRREESGNYLPSSVLSETDAEKTTGVDFNGNGSLDANVAWDFLDSRGNFGTDGKTNGSMSVGWWGSCDKVALAGTLFKEPTRDVVLNGVTFTPQDVMGLLTVIAESQSPTEFIGNRYDAGSDLLVLADGSQVAGTITSDVDWNGAGTQRPWGDDYRSPGKIPDEVKVTLVDGTEKTFKAVELRQILREDPRDDAALFHTTIQEWIKSGRPAAMDKDSNEHVWNYNFYKVEDALYENGLKPIWAPTELKGFNGPVTDGKITYVERSVTLGGEGGTVELRYWLEEKAGKYINSGYVEGSESPDFLWRAQNEAAFTGTNLRNRVVDPALVKEIYEKSIVP